MILIATAALLAATPQIESGQAPAVVQARASVRIVSGARLRLGETTGSGSDTPAARGAMIQTAAGPQPAKLIEFE